MSTIVGFVLKCRSREQIKSIVEQIEGSYRPVALSGGGCWAALLGLCGAAPLPAALGNEGHSVLLSLLPPLPCKTAAWILLRSQL